MDSSPHPNNRRMRCPRYPERDSRHISCLPRRPVLPILEVQGVAEVGLPDVTVFVCRAVGALRTRVLVPLRDRMMSGFVIRHQANGEPLAMRTRLVYGEIDNLPPKYPMLGLDGFPIPSAICNGGPGEIWSGVCLGQPGDRANLRPGQGRIQRLAIESLKCGDAHPWIHQYIGDLFWPDNNGVFLRPRRGETSGQDQNSEPHQDFHE